MLTVDRLREVLDYNPGTGIFTWKVNKGRMQAGSVAGSVTKRGYVRIVVDQQWIMAHRLAWLYSYGEWPDEEIDHKNEIKTDNRIENLRPATRLQNTHNVTVLHRHNTSGFKGVSKYRHRWRATINNNGKIIVIGDFDTPEEASHAYLTTKTELHTFWIQKE